MAESRDAPNWPRAVLRALLTAAILAGLAEGAKRLSLLPTVAPAPSEIAAEVIANPALALDAMGATALRAMAGFAIAAAVAIVAGGIAVTVRALHAPINIIGGMLTATPVIVTTPLLATLAGNGPQLPVIVSALACQFPLLVGTIRGIRAADGQQRELLHILAASRWQNARYLLAPAALPSLFTACKIAAPAAVIGVTTAEWLGAQRGVGAMMIAALFSSDILKIWLAAILTCVLASGAYGVFRLIEAVALRGVRDCGACDATNRDAGLGLDSPPRF